MIIFKKGANEGLDLRMNTTTTSIKGGENKSRGERPAP